MLKNFAHGIKIKKFLQLVNMFTAFFAKMIKVKSIRKHCKKFVIIFAHKFSQ